MRLLTPPGTGRRSGFKHAEIARLELRLRLPSRAISELAGPSPGSPAADAREEVEARSTKPAPNGFQVAATINESATRQSMAQRVTRVSRRGLMGGCPEFRNRPARTAWGSARRAISACPKGPATGPRRRLRP